MKRNVGLLALALGLGLLVAACGGGGGGSGSAGGERLSKDAYLTEVKAVGDKMSETMDALGDTASDPKAGAKQFETLGAALNAAADELKGINPPEDVQAAHEKFAEGIAELGDDIAKAGEGLKTDDIGAAMTFMADLAGSDAMKKIQEAADDLEKAGYNVG
jgi:hypothetical protein